MTTNASTALVPTPIAAFDPLHLWQVSVAWFDSHAAQIAVASAIGFGIYLLLGVAKRLGKRLRDRDGQPGFATVIARAISRTKQFFMILVSARLVVGFADAPEVVFTIIRFLFTIAAVFQGAIWLREIILGIVENRAGDDGRGETIASAMGIIRLLVTVVLFAIAIIMVLDNLGVNVTGLIAGLGIGGIAIGLAAQGIFSDLFAALSIIFDKPFRKGEVINYDLTTATVEHIGLKSTRLRAVTGEKKIIGNTKLLEKEITSYSHLERRRIKFAFGLIYQTDPDKAAQIPDMLKEMVEAQDCAFVRCGFIAFGASSLDYELEFDVYLPDWDDIYKMRHRMGMAMLKLFAQEKLEFAYPTQTSFTAAPDGSFVLPYNPDLDMVSQG